MAHGSGAPAGAGIDDCRRPGSLPSTPLRRRARAVLFVALVAAQVWALHAAYDDPHHTFGFQMFAESSTWTADIVRVTVDGRRVPVEEPWPGGYRWEVLVPVRRMAYPGLVRPADSGAAAQIDYLQGALDWVAAHTPADTETRYLEADVTYWFNTKGPRHVTLRSPERAVTP